jgi:hypothetical protein
LEHLVGGGDAVLACGAVEGLLLGAEIPEDPKALGGAQRMLVAEIDIGWAVLASGSG